MNEHVCSQKKKQFQVNEEDDKITWTLTANGNYSAKSAYEQQFIARIPMPWLSRVWKIKGESKVKFFIWTLRTADRLQRRGWDHQASCCACDQVLESAKHLILDCPFAKEVWHLMADQFKDASAVGLQAASINNGGTGRFC
jgi:hypothetical protein